MKPVVIIGAAVGCSVIAVFGILIVWDTIQQQEAERQAIIYLNELEMQRERDQLQYEADVKAYEDEQRATKSYASGMRSLRDGICREAYTSHGDLSLFQRCLDAVEDDMWYYEQGGVPPSGLKEYCKGLPLGYGGVC